MQPLNYVARSGSITGGLPISRCRLAGSEAAGDLQEGDIWLPMIKSGKFVARECMQVELCSCLCTCISLPAARSVMLKTSLNIMKKI